MSSATQLDSHSAGGVHTPGGGSACGTLDDRLLVICALSWGAGLIHAVAALEHLHEYALYALFFAVLTPLQFGWGIVVFRRPTLRRVVIGAAASLLVAGLWVVSRTSGLPIGPRPWAPEPIGAIDSIATANEMILVLLAFDWARSQSGHGLLRVLSRVLTGLGICLASLSPLALMASGHGG